MKCYNCGCNLSEHNFCTSCGADVSMYKRIMRVSNMYYNEGLERASVRDLTGALTSLRQSLKFNKDNVEARNLLGLVYFEMGEVVAALSEWVISKNQKPNKNLADYYLDMIQNNPSRLESINQTIKKYNQALMYCSQDSKDLAIIQLKKVLSLNPRFIRAHQLLALLYIDSEQWDRAKKELDRCANVDNHNTLTLRYRKEVDKMLTPDENVKTVTKRGKDEALRYQSDNEVIIQPMNVKEPKRSGIGTLLNVAIGLILGMAVMFFLIMPSAVSRAKSEAQDEVRTIGNQLDERTSTIETMQQEMNALTAENDELHTQLDAYVGTDGTIQTMEELLSAAQEYLSTGDIQATAVYLENIANSITLTDTSEAFQSLYQTILTAIGPDLSAQYYTTGYSAYRNSDYAQAIIDLGKAVYYDATNGDALFNLGNAYRQNGQNAEAIETYQKMVELFPDTERARRARQYIGDLSAN